MDQGRCISSSNGEFECCSNFYLDSDICKPCPPGTYGVNCSFSCPRLMYGDGCGYICNCSPDRCDAVYGCGMTTTSTDSYKPTSTERPVTVSTQSFLTQRVEITESPSSTISTLRDTAVNIRDETEPFPYRAIIIGMGVVLSFFLVFTFIQLCSKMRSKRKRIKSSEESGIYHEIPAADERVPQEITEHYNQVTEQGNISSIKKQENMTIQKTPNSVGPYRPPLYDDIKQEEFNPSMYEKYLHDMYLTVEEAKKDETDLSSDSEIRESYLEPISKQETHFYTHVMGISNDTTSSANTERDKDTSMHSDCEDNDASVKNASPKDNLEQQELYLQVIQI
ncbi:uncharacterized protein LOC134230467 [Saccostrea cucullata]|uniref:uncharacterized protein LOC134230467 n=1 Tax=Saccostrea cuccullata TaxID=36930 RepID=UPI002ED67066